MMRRRTVLVFRTGHLGDTVCAIPAFRLLRRHFEGDRLVLFCDRPNGGKVAAAEICEQLGVFDQIQMYRSETSLITALKALLRIRSLRPEVVVILPQVREDKPSLERKRAFFRWCGVRDIRGVDKIPSPDQHSHEWRLKEPDRLVKILNDHGIRGEKPCYEIRVNDKARQEVVSKLRHAGIDAGRPFIVFCGGGKVMTQRWSLSRYGNVLQALAQRLRWPVVAFGSPGELFQYRAELLPVFPNLCIPDWNLGISEIFELCRLAAVYIGNDTGPMHVAAAVGCPVVVVMSARNAPGMWDPDVESRLVIRNRTSCENCFLDECVREQHQCMAAITVDLVTRKAIQFIESLAIQ